MTVEEMVAREAIRHTLAAYNMAGDRLKVEDFVAVFTEDGVLETDGFRQEGRPAIRAWMGGFGKPSGEPAGPPREAPRFVRHNLTTSLIELTGPETARARTYWIVYTQIGPDHSGYYLDDFRKVGERWLIAHRRARTDWHAPNGLFRPAEG